MIMKIKCLSVATLMIAAPVIYTMAATMMWDGGPDGSGTSWNDPNNWE